ncbi:SMI1/KNR4 family protein [Lentibacillus jeotgali]|uniref:SMI1/KNR4 family protein n=1 Tax=Lentibacillus jeotgali TaxID=558169 RepID=UPI00026267DA|nr:SMI1/KNR4 family protein [Lentibacillus jeotgali]
MWKDFISSISKDCYFEAPATEPEIAYIKENLNVELPKKLLELYRETNGVFNKSEYENYPLIWPTSRIIKENLFLRNFDEYKDIFMPFNHLLFFSDSGTGDLFGYPIFNGIIHTDSIFVWDHEDDSRNMIASSIEDFIKRWIAGKIRY